MRRTGDAPFINWHRLHLPEGLLQESFMEAETLTERRKKLGGLLESEGYSWRQVYSNSCIEDYSVQKNIASIAFRECFYAPCN